MRRIRHIVQKVKEAPFFPFLWVGFRGFIFQISIFNVTFSASPLAAEVLLEKIGPPLLPFSFKMSGPAPK